MLSLIAVTINLPVDAALLGRCIELLPVQERAEVAKYRLEADQFRSTVGRLLPRVLLAQQGIDWRRVMFDRTPRGKPYVRGDESSTVKMEFNVSHDERVIAMLASLEGQEKSATAVGVDVMKVELPHDTRNVEALIESLEEALSTDERARLDEMSGEAKLWIVLEMWTRKEAYIKAEGQCISDELSSMTATADGDLLLRDASLREQGWTFLRELHFSCNAFYVIAEAIKDRTAAPPVLCKLSVEEMLRRLEEGGGCMH